MRVRGRGVAAPTPRSSQTALPGASTPVGAPPPPGGKSATPQVVPIHMSTLWGHLAEPDCRRAFGIHISFTCRCRNPKQIRHLHAISMGVYSRRRQWGRDRALLGPRLLMGLSGSLGEGADANKGTGACRSQGTRRLWQVRPIARLTHLAMAQRGALREAGTRSGRTRSARSGEPCGAAAPRGDRSRSFRRPYREPDNRQPVAVGRKTKE